jgi:hypothetical protein
MVRKEIFDLGLVMAKFVRQTAADYNRAEGEFFTRYSILGLKNSFLYCYSVHDIILKCGIKGILYT